jgi:hypothetical protein
MVQKLDADMIEDGALSAKLDKAGGTMTGALVLSGAPAVDLNPATKAYVDARPAPKGHLSGLALSNNGTDATNDIDIAAGEAASDDAVLMALASSLTKRLDAAWAVGSGNGGLDTGSIANTTYHVFLIQRSDTGVVDALFSTSATAPTMPANYDRKRRIGSIMRASAAIRPFKQRGDTFLHSNGIVGDVAAQTQDNTRTLRTLSVPLGIQVTALLVATASHGTLVNRLLRLSSPDELDEAPGNYAQFVTQVAGQMVGAEASILTDTSARIATRGDTTSFTLNVATKGWVDRRGRG